MVRRLGLGKNNHLTYDSLALNPRYLMDTSHNMCLNEKSNQKTMKDLDCALIGVCVVIRSNMVSHVL